MKILVSIKRTPQRDARLKVDEGGQLQLGDVKFEVNPFDELALEEALRIKESRSAATEVVVVTVGGEECQEQILAALAMGADRALRVDTRDELDRLQIAKVLAAVVERESPDLYLAGKLAYDDESSQIPAMVAGLLGWPQASQASKIELTEDGAIANVTCEVDDGLEHVGVSLPAVVTADLRLNEPRYASLPNIMKAKKKPLEEKTPADYGVDVSPRLEVVRTAEPPERKAGMMVGSVDDLVENLKDLGVVCWACCFWPRARMAS